MSNPFDQFASDFSAALPPAAATGMYGAPHQPPPQQPPPQQQQQQQQPIMMTHVPPPQQPAPLPLQGNPYPYGAPSMEGNPYAAPVESTSTGMGMSGYGAYPPQPPPPFAGYGGPPVPHQSPNRYDGGMGGAAAGGAAFAPESPMGQSVPTSVYMHNQPDNTYTAYSATPAPAPGMNDPWGGPPAGNHQPPSLPPLGHDSSIMPPSHPPLPPSADANPYGAPPPPPVAPVPAEQHNPYGAPQAAAIPYHPSMPPHPQPHNPYGAPLQMEQQPHDPYGVPIPTEPNPYGAPTDQGQPPPNSYSVPPEQHQQSQSQQLGPFGAPLEQSNPYGAQMVQPPNPYGAPPDQQQQQQQQMQMQMQPYGVPTQAAAADQYALVPSQTQSNPYANYAPGYGQPVGPYGQPPPQPYGHPGGYGAPQPPPPPPVDPFSVFETQRAPEPAPAPFLVGSDPSSALVVAGGAQSASAGDDEFWGSFVPAGDKTQTAAGEEPQQPVETPERRVEEEEKKGDEGLPPGGEWYDARIFTPTLGVMFFKPQELTDSLFLNADKDLVEALGERPVVAFIVEGSSARSAGVELGHVLLKVNNIDVRSPKEASRLIKEGPRPLPLLFYVPNTDVVVAEGEHMVKYDTKETTAPNSANDWKPKYVVIGGIIAQPWMMNMYRSKSEYDIAVIETQARRPVSVKVKQFSLQGARIQNDWQGPQMVKYKNKLHPWKYICVLPVARNPIKISSPNLSQLKPVHEGIRRLLLAQQRGGGAGRARPTGQGQSNSARDDGQHQGGGNYSGERHQSERNGASSQQNYDSPPRQSHTSGGDSYGRSHPQPTRQPQRAYGY